MSDRWDEIIRGDDSTKASPEDFGLDTDPINEAFRVSKEPSPKKPGRDRSKPSTEARWWVREGVAPFAFRGDQNNPSNVPYRVGNDNKIYVKSGAMGYQPLEKMSSWEPMVGYDYIRNTRGNYDEVMREIQAEQAPESPQGISDQAWENMRERENLLEAIRKEKEQNS